MIIDTIIFRNELDILDLRIAELRDRVDLFLVVEGDKIHLTGEKRDQFLTDELRKQLETKHNVRILNKISSLKNDSVGINNGWHRERSQVQSIYDYLLELNLNEDDLILFSGADEIPNLDLLNEIQKRDLTYLNQLYFVYYANFFSSKAVVSTACCKWGKLKKIQEHYSACMVWLRDRKDYGFILDNGGVHYSYFGGVDMLVTKGKTIVEGREDYDKNFFQEQLDMAIKERKTPYSEWKIQFLNLEKKNQVLDYYDLRFTGKTKQKKEWKVRPDKIFNYPELIYNY